MEGYDGRQVVGMDLHRRRSVLVRMTEDGRRLGMARITNSPQELRAQLARAGTSPKVVLEATYGCFRAGRRLDLSPKEFALLECLLASGDTVVSAEELLERVWDEEADPFTTAVKTTVRRLRAKLGDPPIIQTVREGGYRIGEL